MNMSSRAVWARAHFSAVDPDDRDMIRPRGMFLVAISDGSNLLPPN